MTSSSRLHKQSASSFTAPPPVEATRARAVRAALRHEGEVHHAHIVNPMVLQAARELITRDDKGQKTNISATGHPYDVLEDISNDLYTLGLSQRATVGILDALARYTVDLGTDFVREARAKPLYARIRVTEKLPDDLPDCDLVQTVMIDGQRQIGDGISTRVMEATIYGTRTSMTNTMSLEQALSSGKKKWLLIYFGSPSSTDIRGLNTIDLTMMNLLQGVGAQLPPDDRRALIAAIQDGKLAPEAKQLIEALAKIEQTLDLNGHLPPKTPDDRAILQALMAEVTAQLENPELLPLIPPALVAAAEEKIRDTHIEITPTPPPADLIMGAEDGSVVSRANTPAANDPTTITTTAAPPPTIESLIAQVERLAALPEIDNTHRAILTALLSDLQQASQPQAPTAPPTTAPTAAAAMTEITPEGTKTDLPTTLIAAQVLALQDSAEAAPLAPPPALLSEKLEALSAQLVQIAVNEGVPLPAYEMISTLLPQVSALQHATTLQASVLESAAPSMTHAEQAPDVVSAPADPVTATLQTAAAVATASPAPNPTSSEPIVVGHEETAPSAAQAIDMTSAFAKTAPSSPSEGTAISAEPIDPATVAMTQPPESLDTKSDQGTDAAPLPPAAPTGSEAEKAAPSAIDAAAAPASETTINAAAVTAQAPVESSPAIIVTSNEVKTIEGAAPTADTPQPLSQNIEASTPVVAAPALSGQDATLSTSTPPAVEAEKTAPSAIDAAAAPASETTINTAVVTAQAPVESSPAIIVTSNEVGIPVESSPMPEAVVPSVKVDTPAHFVEKAIEVSAPSPSPAVNIEASPVAERPAGVETATIDVTESSQAREQDPPPTQVLAPANADIVPTAPVMAAFVRATPDEQIPLPEASETVPAALTTSTTGSEATILSAPAPQTDPVAIATAHVDTSEIAFAARPSDKAPVPSSYNNDPASGLAPVVDQPIAPTFVTPAASHQDTPTPDHPVARMEEAAPPQQQTSETIFAPFISPARFEPPAQDIQSSPSQIYSQAAEPQEPITSAPSGFVFVETPKVADTQAQYEDRAKSEYVAPIEPQPLSVSSTATFTESPLASFANQARVDEAPLAPAPTYAHEDYSVKATPETPSGFAKSEPADDATKWASPSLQTIQADDLVYSPAALAFKEDVSHEGLKHLDINDRRREDDPTPSIQPDTSPAAQPEPKQITSNDPCSICPVTGSKNCLCHIFNQAIEQQNTPAASYSSAELAAGPLDKLPGLKEESRDHPVIKDGQPASPAIKPSEPKSSTLCPVTGAANCLCHIFSKAIEQQRDLQERPDMRSRVIDEPAPSPTPAPPVPSSEPKRAMTEEFCRVCKVTGKIGCTCDIMNAAIENRDHQGDALKTTLPADGAEESFDKIQALMKKNRKSIENPGVKSKKQDEFDIF